MNQAVHRLTTSGLWLCLMIGVQTVALGQQPAQSPQGESNPCQQQTSQKVAEPLLYSGRVLSSQEADNLESRLSTDPSDLAAHVSLIGYYFSKDGSTDGSIIQKKRGHILWLIQNHPDSQLHKNPVARLYVDKEGFEQAEQLWLKQVAAFKGNSAVLSNAINFVLIQDKPLAEKLLKQAAAAEPRDAQWPRRLGELYGLQMYRASDDTRRKMALLSYEQYEQAYGLTTEKQQRFYLLATLAKAALAAGDVTRAKTLAVELLDQAKTMKDDWNYGNAIHHGHIILGRIALLSGNIDEAKEHLIEAGKTPGSPQLDSFGPNMTLAKDLLEKGEAEVVIQYFLLCANFWKTHQEILNKWTSLVKQGGIPDFGANILN